MRTPWDIVLAACLGAVHQQAPEFEACGAELQGAIHDCAFILIGSSHCIVTLYLADSGSMQQPVSTITARAA